MDRGRDTPRTCSTARSRVAGSAPPSFTLTTGSLHPAIGLAGRLRRVTSTRTRSGTTRCSRMSSLLFGATDNVDAIREISGRSGFLQRRTYRYAEVDVVLLEGIFLLRRELLRSYDRTIWIDCTFRTALERALERNQEHLPPEQIEHDYRTIYVPAQHHHASRDAPRERAGIVVLNDERLAAPARPGEAAASAA